MTESITIRQAKSGESQLLSEVALRSKSYWGYSAEFMKACRAELSVSAMDIARPDCHYFIAESKSEILGYYALQRLSAEKYELEALFVDPQSIGQGVGRKLIEHAKRYAQKDGARFLTIQGDPNATGFYRAAGAVQVGERESGSIPGRYLPEFTISLGDENAV